MKVCGIYKIVNRVNGRYYVGSSKDILGRDSVRPQEKAWSVAIYGERDGEREKAFG
jgi:hypothetical protein